MLTEEYPNLLASVLVVKKFFSEGHLDSINMRVIELGCVDVVS